MTTTIGLTVVADAEVIPRDERFVRIRHVDGQPVCNLPDGFTTPVWTNDRVEVETSLITLDDVSPGLHWLDVWHRGTRLWTGVIRQVSRPPTGIVRVIAVADIEKGD